MDRVGLDAVIDTFVSVMEDSPVKKVLVNVTLLFKKESIEVVQAQIIAINDEELENGEVKKEKE